ncbi:MAG: glycosyltransferase family 2 protein [Chloroflexota bacterium]
MPDNIPISPSDLTEGGPCPDLSVIIVSWNVREDLLRCLDALLSNPVSSGLRLQVIVVDNASTDGTVESIRDLPVTIIENAANVGYGRANNMGLRAAEGRYLLVLNPDTVPQPASLSNLIRFADARPAAGIVAPRLLNPDGTVQAGAFAFPTLAMAAIDLFPLPKIVPGRLRVRLQQSGLNGRYPGEARRTKPFKIDHPLGACLLIRREAYEQCGGFDEQLFMYSEEIDLALHYAQVGWECWQVPQARVVHLGGQSTRQMPEAMFVELWRSRLYLYAKNYGLFSRLALTLLLTVAMLRDMVTSLMRGLFRTEDETSMKRRKRAQVVLRMLFNK